MNPLFETTPAGSPLIMFGSPMCWISSSYNLSLLGCLAQIIGSRPAWKREAEIHSKGKQVQGEDKKICSQMFNSRIETETRWQN